MGVLPFVKSGLASGAQISRDFVGQHLLKTKSEKVRGIPAVRSGHHVSTKASCPARTTMTTSAAIAETSAERQVSVDVTQTVIGEWPLSLAAQELALKDLSSTTNCAKGITSNDE
jgi:hypothetical protein